MRTEWRRTISFCSISNAEFCTPTEKAITSAPTGHRKVDGLQVGRAVGHPGGRPVGSGWFVVAVKAGQCGEKKAGLFGCRFDATGKPTTCGTAKVKEESGELEVVVKK